MKPLFVRKVTAEERAALEAGLRSSKVFTVKRCQMLLASLRGQTATQIAVAVGYSTQNVRNAITRFNEDGVRSLVPRSSAAHTVANRELDAAALEQLKALLHESPRSLGIERSTWTLKALALVSHQRGITSRELTDEAIRKAIKRLGVGWKRAKNWITSPDPAYARKKNDATN
jgi:transposase